MQPENTILIILGYPADENGEPGEILKARLDKGIEIYKHGFASKIIVSGAAVYNPFVEAEVMAVYCIKNGVAAKDIIMEPNARNTYENAKLVKGIMENEQYEKALVVTSSFHKLRAKKYFSKHIKNARVIPAPFPAKFPIAKRIWYNLKEYIIIILFSLGLLNSRYSVENQG